MEEPSRGRRGELVEPSLRRRRQLLDVLMRDWSRGAPEPLRGHAEHDGFQPPQLGRMQSLPTPPEGIVSRVCIEKTRELINMKRASAGVENVLQHVERCEAQPVGKVQHGKRNSCRLAHYAARPELVRVRHRKALQLAVPESKMQLHRERHFGIEEIAAPLPSRLADQRRNVIGRRIVHRLQRLESERQHYIARGFDMLLWSEQVEIVLRAIFRDAAEIRTVRQPFESGELDPRGFELLRQSPIEILQKAQTLQIVRGIFVRTLAHPLRHDVAHAPAKRQGELRPIAEIEGLLPFPIRQAGQKIRSRILQIQRRQNGCRAAGKPRPWVAQLRIVTGPAAKPWRKHSGCRLDTLSRLFRKSAKAEPQERAFVPRNLESRSKSVDAPQMSLCAKSAAKTFHAICPPINDVAPIRRRPDDKLAECPQFLPGSQSA